MKKRMIGIFCILLFIISAGSSSYAQSVDDVPYYSYTYGFEQGNTIISPHAYLPGETIYLSGLGKKLFEPEDMFITKTGTIVIADTRNNRIVEFDSDGKYKREMSSFYNIAIFGEDILNTPKGVFVSDNGDLFVADTVNARVLWFDSEWKLRKSFIYPATELIDRSIDYLPVKVACNTQGRIFILAQNINQGIIEIDQEGKFVGFLGSAKVKVNVSDLFWRILATDKQKQRMTLFVPSEYNNMSLDEEDFIYCTTAAVSEADLYAAAMNRSTDDRYAPVRRINPSGTDVLKRAGAFPPQGDLWTKSVLVDVTVRDNGIYSVLDSAMGRVFTYDINGNLLYVFGQTGERNGTMKEPVSIGNIGDTLYVLDKSGALYKYFPTEYGNAIHAAVRKQNLGEFTAAHELWKETLKYNQNYELALIEIGKTQLRQGAYADAMVNFKDGSNRGWYSEAKKLYLNQSMDRNFNRIALGFFIAILGILMIIFRKKLFARFIKVKEVRKQSAGMILLKQTLEKIGFAFYTNIHPFKGFWDGKYEKKGSVFVATGILATLILSSIIKRQGTEYLYNFALPEELNVLMEITAVIIPMLLWCTANWAVTTLFDGKGKFRDIYIYTSYSLIPLIGANIISTLYSHTATSGDATLYGLITSIALVWTVGLILIGTLTVHEYTMSKTLLSCVSIAVSMALMMFVALVFIKVIQQIYGFAYVLAKEIILRL